MYSNSEIKTLFSAIAATATSGMVGLADWKNKSVQLNADTFGSGSGTLTLQVSNDGTTWVGYNRITTNVTNTNAQTDLRAASIAASATGGVVGIIPDSFQYIRGVLTITGTGTYSAYLHLNR